MKALVCREFGPPSQVTAVQTLPPPAAIADNEVLIAVGHATVSHATGLLIEGKYQKTPPLPFVPGTEGVGKVLQCGKNVQHTQPGDTVVFICAWGAYSEQLVVHASTVYPVPAGLDPLQALALPISYGTAFTALHWRAQIQEGDSLLVLGAGSGVGAAAVELAAQIPHVKVIACASTEDKRQAEAVALALDGLGAGLWPQLFTAYAARHPEWTGTPGELAALLFQWLFYSSPYLRIFEWLMGAAAARFFLLKPQAPANLDIVAAL